MNRYFISTLLTLCIHLPLLAQVLERPSYLSERFTDADVALLDQVSRNVAVELEEVTANKPFFTGHIRKARLYAFEGIYQGVYIRNDSLQALLEEVGNQLIQANDLGLKEPVFLIRSSGFTNAKSLMINVYEFDISLFGLLGSKDELAFVMAHELAHQVKYHVAQEVLLGEQNKPGPPAKGETGGGLKRKALSDEISKAQQVLYKVMSHSRKIELEADSLGLVYMRNAGFDAEVSLKALNKLGYGACHSPKDIRGHFTQLFSPRFGPKPGWFEERLPLYNKMPRYLSIYRADSLNTHPHQAERTERLEKWTNADSVGSEVLAPNQIWQEMIWACYETKQFELALFYALIYVDQLGYDQFISSMIAGLFLDLSWARYDHHPDNNLYQYLSYRTINFTSDLMTINSILFNMNRKDYLQTGFMLLNNAQVFDKYCEEHYYLLFQYARLLGKEQTASKIRDTYFSLFDGGKYTARAFR